MFRRRLLGPAKAKKLSQRVKGNGKRVMRERLLFNLSHFQVLSLRSVAHP